MKKMRILLLVMAIACTFALYAGAAGAVTVDSIKSGEDVLAYVKRVKGGFDQTLYQQVMGAAAAYKDGDEGLGVAAADDVSRVNARMLLANTKIKDIHSHPLFEDNVQKLIWKTTDAAQYKKVNGWTMGELKHFLLTASEADIKGIMHGLNSDVIGSIVKLMGNEELTAVSKKIFNPLPGSKLGTKGYLGARIQPNSPTDNIDDIMWQVFNGWSYATGDFIIGTNPVSDSVKNIVAVEKVLKDILVTFGLEKDLPWCVLSHIDKQVEAEKQYPGETAIWFQSIAGVDAALKTFNISVAKMMDYAKMRNSRYGLYLETGQGADYTNGAGNGFDMVIHESRKYGLCRAMQQEIDKLAPGGKAWLHVNNVAGFIGPEVFKTREQLVRVCLEDLVMGKLHGLTMGFDVCATLHMPISLDDLDWAQDQVAPANPAYLMGMSTKNDPMLSYMTTAFQDHVRLREKFGYKVSDPVWAFLKRIKIVDENDKYTEHFGDPIWVYYQYLMAKGDKRSKEEIYAEGEATLKGIAERGVPISRGHGKNLWDLEPELDKKIRDNYDNAKIALWSEFSQEFIDTIPNAVIVSTTSKDREEYVAHPPTGEKLSPAAVATLEKLRDAWSGKTVDVQIVISDGLNTNAIMDEGHLAPYLEEVRKELTGAGFTVSEKHVVMKSGRVRAGYAIGSVLFAKPDVAKPKVILHVIGERPGSGHNNYSVYIAAPNAEIWVKKGVDHDIARVISGISDTAYNPADAARETVTIVKEMTGP